MSMNCPHCSGEVPSDQLNIRADTGLCPHCGEMFRPSSSLAPSRIDYEGYPDEAFVQAEKPPEREVVIEYFDDGGVGMYLPTGGLKSKGAMAMFVFAVFWNGIVLCVGSGFVAGMAEGEVPWLMILFFVPFVVIGVAMPLWGCWLAWGQTKVGIDPQGVWIEQTLFGRKRLRTFPLEKIERFRRKVAYTQNDDPVYACSVKVDGKHHNFGHKLSDEHQVWMVREFNVALQRLRGVER